VEPNEVRAVFAVVDKVSSASGRVRDRSAVKELTEAVESLFALVGPVSAAVAGGVLELGRGEVAGLVDSGVLPMSRGGVEPRRLHDVLVVARELRARQRDLDKIRWWLEDRALLADEAVVRGLAEPGDDVLAPHARRQVDGMDQRSRKKVEAWLEKLGRQGVRATQHRVTGTSERLCVAEVGPLRAVVAFPTAKRAVVLRVQPPAGTYGHVHVLGKSKPKDTRTTPAPGGGDRLPGWSTALTDVAERAAALVDRR
jgi:hypothetical protein